MSGATTYPKRPWSGPRSGSWQGQQPTPPPAAVPDKVSIKGPKDLWFTLQTIKKGKTTKTTKAMRLPGGLLISTTTIGQIYAAEALCYVPGTDVVRTADGGGAIVAKVENVPLPAAAGPGFVLPSCAQKAGK